MNECKLNVYNHRNCEIFTIYSSHQGIFQFYLKFFYYSFSFSLSFKALKISLIELYLHNLGNFLILKKIIPFG